MRKTIDNYIWGDDTFLELQASERDLYIYFLCKGCDLYGIVGGTKMAFGLLGANKEDLAALVDNGFLLAIKGKYVVKDYWKHNSVTVSFKYARERYKCPFVELLSMLKIDSDNCYSLEEGISLDDFIEQTLEGNKSKARNDDKERAGLVDDIFRAAWVMNLFPKLEEQEKNTLANLIAECGEENVRRAFSIILFEDDNEKRNLPYLSETARGLKINGPILEQGRVPLLTHEMFYPNYSDSIIPPIPKTLNPLQQIYANKYGTDKLNQLIQSKSI